MRAKSLFAFLLASLISLAAAVAQGIDTSPQHYERALQWADSVMDGMSHRERIAQLFMVNVAPQQNDANRKAVRDYIEHMKLGGIYFSGGTLEEHLAMNNMVVRLGKTPAMIGFDGEWGLGMRIKSVPSFPRNAVLGCIADNDLIKELGREVGRQCKAIGVDIDFAPVADVNTNPDNPVIGTRSFGEDRARVADKAVAFASGLEGAGVLSVLKHFPGHGDTSIDSHKALPKVAHDRSRLDSIEMYPFRQAVAAGLHGVMVGHISVPAIDPTPGLPSSLSRPVSDVLRDDIGFRWLVFTDALAMKGVAGFENVCLKALQAGNDVVLSPVPVKPQLDAVVHAARHDKALAAELDAKCRKVLAFKFLMGVQDKKEIDAAGLYDRIVNDASRQLMQRLHKAAVTVVSDNYGRLPVMRQGQAVAVVRFDAAVKPFASEMDELANVEVYAFSSLASFNAKAEALQAYPTVIVPILASTPSWAVQALKQIPKSSKVFVFFTSMKEVEKWKQAAPASSAMVLSHVAEDYVQQHTARVICGLERADGRLSMTIPGVARGGAGLDLLPDLTERQVRAEDVGMSSDVLARIDSVAVWGITEQAYPGCQILVMRHGKPVYDKCFGTHEYGDSRLVRFDDIYDIASMTKTSGTLLAVMKLYDQWRLKLDDRVVDYLPWLKGSDKEDITIRSLLFHESGLMPSLPFFAAALDSASFTAPFYSYRRDGAHGRRIGRNLYVPSDFDYDEAYLGRHYNRDFRWQVAEGMFVNDAYRAKALQMITDSKLRSKRYSYSCVGFILLKEIVEAITGEPMDTYLNREFFYPLGLRRTFFNPLQHYPASKIVPTLTDDFLHRGRLQGYVHDDSAAFFGGVSGNAGMFSTAEELARIYQMILAGGTFDGRTYLSLPTCRLFTTAKSGISRRGLGFDRSYEGDNRKSPCSPLTPGGVYGHTGFTGTCVWVDPANDLIYIFLSNRVYPDGLTNKLAKLGIRSKIQDIIYEALED